MLRNVIFDLISIELVVGGVIDEKSETLIRLMINGNCFLSFGIDF